MSRSPRTRRPGYTLVELMVSMAAGSLLMVGLASALLIANRMAAAPLASQRAVRAAQVLSQLADDLQYATDVVQRTSRMIEFATADQNGDGSPELIRYAWSGQPGDPLEKTVNGSAPVVVAEAVEQFQLNYQTAATTETLAGVRRETAEQLLASWVGSTNLNDRAIKHDDWRAQYFKPALPAEAVSWSVSRVAFKAKKAGGDTGQTLVQLRPAAGDTTPTSVVLEQVTLMENTLSDAYQWVAFPYTDTAGLSPSDGLCLVLEHVKDKESCKVQYQDGGVTAADSAWSKSTNQGASWTVESGKGLQYEVYGRYVEGQPDLAASRQYLTGVRVSLQLQADAASLAETAVQLANSPELLSAWWTAEFDQDPTQLDVNFDGQPDWRRRDGAPFDPGSLSGGVWGADAVLETAPARALTSLTTVVVRLRNATVGGDGAVVDVPADWSGGRYAALRAKLQLQADGTQTLTVTDQREGEGERVLAAAAGLGGGFVELRLVVAPAQDAVNIRVDGADLGTPIYETIPAAGGPQPITLQASGSSAEFDYVSVRVGE